MKYHLSFIAILMPLALGQAAELHVAINGNDASPGTPAAPFRTIQRAADLAQPGDTVTVHAGVYRERINPPRGGESDAKRIVYQAAAGEKVVITGSEEVKNWEKVQDGVWKATLPNTLFGSFNPFAEIIAGDWFHANDRTHHVGAVYLNGHWLTEAVSLEEVLKPITATSLWFASVDATRTVIWAQFKGIDPNAQQVEVNARRSVFYPEKPGMNFITVRGFTLRNAATPWAPPTVEQIGLIGVHWSKGWIIENNDIAYSTCSGITLGKYGDAKDQNSGSAKGYVTTIERGLQNGWNKETVGHHVVRDNHISHCEQVGIVGSLGAVFSTVTGNTIHDIHVRQLFSGAEMAGIKFHGAIDVTISGNHIYRTCRGIWLDWMTQGARISNNLCHDNATHDLFVEVNHGPFVVDNNLFLSPKSIEDDSQGGAYAHNLIAGGIDLNPTFFDGRKTPFHKVHSTEIVALHDNPSGDNHYYNNLFMRSGSLVKYDQAHLPMSMDGNVFFQGTQSSKHERDPINRSASDPGLTLVEKNDGYHLTMTIATALGSERPSQPVTSSRLGKASISGCAFENPDGSPITIGTDYFGKPRNAANPTPGPFEAPGTGTITMKVWPLTVGRKALQPTSPVRADDLAPSTEADEENARQERIKWWRDGKFGMFVCWGLYSIPAGTWKDHVTKRGYAEWVMFTPIPVKEYEQLATQFNPVKFDAGAWTKLARQTGMRYMVFTTKFHDGFSMFKSQLTPYNIVDATPFKRDVTRELADACHEAGMKFGCYYSVDRDWYRPQGPGNRYKQNNTWDYPDSKKEDFDKYFETFAKPQVEELLTHYRPDLFWFDEIHMKTDAQDESLYQAIRRIRPECVINSRLKGCGTPPDKLPLHQCDYLSLGDNEIAKRILGVEWENAGSMNSSYGYNQNDVDWIEAKQIVCNLVEIVSKGGNYLLNVGPTAEGLIPQACIDRLMEVGAWMDVNQECIYGTSVWKVFGEGPGFENKKETAGMNIRFTAKGNSLYAICLDWPEKEVVVKAFGKTGVAGQKVAGVSMLGVKDEIKWSQSDEGLTVSVPKDKPCKHAYVYKIDLNK